MQVPVAEQGVVVEVDLGIDRHDPLIVGQHQRVDLGQTAVLFDEDLREPVDRIDRLFCGISRQAQRPGQRARLELLQPQVRVHPLLEDGGRVAAGDLLDLHAALATGHQHRLVPCAVDDDAEVELGGDRDGLGDHEFSDLHPGRSGLGRDHGLFKHRPARLLDLVGIFADFDVSGLAAAAGVDLGLDDDLAAADLLPGLPRFGRRVDHNSRGYGHARVFQHLPRLVFIYFHPDLPQHESLVCHKCMGNTGLQATSPPLGGNGLPQISRNGSSQLSVASCQ